MAQAVKAYMSTASDPDYRQGWSINALNSAEREARRLIAATEAECGVWYHETRLPEVREALAEALAAFVAMDVE